MACCNMICIKHNWTNKHAVVSYIILYQMDVLYNQNKNITTTYLQNTTQMQETGFSYFTKLRLTY